MEFLVGIDMGGTNVKIGIIRAGKQKRLQCKKIFSTGDFKDKNALINEIAATVKDAVREAGVKKEDIVGVGMGVPGAVDVRRGTVHYLTNISGWREVRLRSILSKKLDLPVFIDNDVNVMALGELFFGSGQGATNMLCITLGTGVGGGLILEGKLYRGSSCAAGEFGHMPITIDGPRCNCGSWGCVEAYVGNNYMVRKVVNRIKKGQRTLIKKLVGNDLSKITPEIISRAARLNDKFAVGLWEEVGNKIGVALAGVVNLLNIEKIVIGGGVAEAGRTLFDSVKKTIKRRAMALPARTVRVVKAGLGYDAGLIGAATLVLYELNMLSRDGQDVSKS